MKHDRGFRIAVSMLLVMLSLLVSLRASAFEVPTPDGAVTDTSGTLTPEDDAYLEARIARYREQTGNRLAVLLVPSLQGESVEDVAYKTFNTWGIGKKGIDNGVLLVIAFAEHRTRIETGKGVGDRLTDLECGHILASRLAPELRAGRLRHGIEVTLVAIEDALGGATAERAPGPDIVGVFAVLALVIGIVGLIGTFIHASAQGTRRTRRPWPRSKDHATATSAPWVHFEASSASTSTSSPSTYDAGTSSSFSGGFDGGSSGGGGASGSW